MTITNDTLNDFHTNSDLFFYGGTGTPGLYDQGAYGTLACFHLRVVWSRGVRGRA